MLAITSELVIRSICKEYLDILGDKAQAYLHRLEEAIGDSVQLQIDQLESWCSSIQTTANNTLSSAATWAVQIPAIATPEPAAPKTGAAALVSLKNSVSQAKAQISMADSQLGEITNTLSNWRIPVPSTLTSLQDLVNLCKTTLDNIPI